MERRSRNGTRWKFLVFRVVLREVKFDVFIAMGQSAYISNKYLMDLWTMWNIDLDRIQSGALVDIISWVLTKFPQVLLNEKRCVFSFI